MVNTILVHVYDYLHPPKYDIILEVPDDMTMGGLKQMVSTPSFHPSVMVAYMNLDMADDADLADENADIQIMRIPHHKMVSHEGRFLKKSAQKMRVRMPYSKTNRKKALPQNHKTTRKITRKTNR